MIVLALGIAFLVGTLAGAVALARWYVWRIRTPEVMSGILQNAYRASHPHWLQRALDDPSLPPSGPGDRCGIRISSVSWATLDGGPDLVGTREQLEELANWWLTENAKDGTVRDYVDYAVRLYAGTDPASAEDIEAYLRRERRNYNGKGN